MVKPVTTNIDGSAARAGELQQQLIRERMPRHVGIIMDGNGRWASKHGFLERIRGHEAGIDSIREITRIAGELNIEALSLYAFSKENWNRPKLEIEALMRLLERFLIHEIPELNQNNVQLLATGCLDDLPKRCINALQRTIEVTANNTGLKLNLALSYGGRDEIVNAARRIAAEAKAGNLAPDSLNEGLFSQYLYQPMLPDPDLIIRTSGEFRVSNFMIWQAAYAEFFITDVLWPDFRKVHFLEALVDYQKRERRFGGVMSS